MVAKGLRAARWSAMSSHLCHILTCRHRRTFVHLVGIIITCLTSALVLESLDDLGDLSGLALKRTPILCVPTAILLLIVARQNMKRASNRSGNRSPHHHSVSLPSRACSKSSTPKTTFMLGDLQEISGPLFPYSIVLWACSTISPVPPRR